MTAEEVTAKRRAERRQFKLDRARAMAEAAEEAEKVFAASGVVLAEPSVVIPSAATWKPVKPDANQTVNPLEPRPEEEEISDEELRDAEHLQLTLPEAFFLVWAMDCVKLTDPVNVSRRASALIAASS